MDPTVPPAHCFTDDILPVKNISFYILLLGSMFICTEKIFCQWNHTIHMDLSTKYLFSNPLSSKFSEYRTLPTGVYTDTFFLGFSNIELNKSLTVQGFHPARNDQFMSARAKQSGLMDIQINWNRVPHNYSNSGRTIFNGVGSGYLEIPKDIRNKFRTMLSTDVNPNVPGIQFDTAGVSQSLNGLARSVDIISERNKVKAFSTYTPNEEIEIKLNYSNEQRTGVKPLGGLFYYQTPVEILEPTLYRTQDASARIEYAAKTWSTRAEYLTSSFRNSIDALVWDNPFRERDFIAGASRGRTALYPSSLSNTFNVSGASQLPFVTRLSLSFSYSERKQSELFMPQTINAAIETLLTQPPLPARQLNGKIGVSTIYLSLTNRFFSELWFSARYRSLHYGNQTPQLHFMGYVDQDNLIVQTQRRNLLVDYRKDNIQTDLTFRLISSTSLKLGYGQELWQRRYGESRNTRERIYSAALHYSLLSRLLINASYAYSVKYSPDYDWPSAEQELYPNGLPVTIVGQLPQLRKFNLAGRERNKSKLFAQYSPSEIVSFTASFGILNDIFKDALYGLSRNNANNISVGISVNPSYDLSFSANYTRERYRYEMTSRQRRPGNDSPNNDWSSEMNDFVNTFSFFTTWTVIPEEVTLSADFSIADARGTVAAKALGNSTLPNYLVDTAEDYPETRSIVRYSVVSLRYRLSDFLSSRINYQFQGYSESFFGQDIMDPYMIGYDNSAPQALYLGITQPGYSAHSVSLSMVYDF